MDSQDIPREETQLDTLDQKDCQSDCTSNFEDNNIVKKSVNGSDELQFSSNSHPMISCIPESCMDARESDNVNPVVTPVLELSLQTVASSSENKAILSVVINTTSLTSIKGETTDSDLLMDLSSSDYPALGSDILESSTLGSDVKSSAFLETEKIDVDVSHEVQQSDLSTSSDTHQLECEAPKLHLPSVCLQADVPINMTSECDSGKTKTSVDDGSVSSEKLPEVETEYKHDTNEDDNDKIMSVIDDSSVRHLVPEAETEYKHATNEDDNDKIMSVIDDSSVSHLVPETEKEHKDVTNEDDKDKMRGSDDSSIFVENIKEEPYDSGYERSDLIYRCGTIIVGSDDDTDSTVFSDNEARDNNANAVCDAETGEQQNTVKVPVSYTTILRTEGEVFPEELPPLEYLTISPDEDVLLEALGTVTGIVGVLVIVKADIRCPALFDDTVLFLEGRHPLGLIFEIFGTVEQPYYSVRFNSNEDIQERGIQAGDKVFFAPNADNLTKYVFIAELRKVKADDASWLDDNEPPIAHQEYSDDEQERRAQRQLRNKERGIEEHSETSVRRKKRRKKPNSDYEKDPQAPQLLQGDLNRNPFESKQQTVNSSRHTRWPRSHSVGNEHKPFNRSRNSTQLPQQPPPTSVAFRHPRPPCPDFAERPGWNQQRGLLGSIPNAMTGPPNRGHFTNNMFNSHQQPPRFGIAPFPPPVVTPPPPRHNVCGSNPHLPQNFMPSSLPRLPPPLSPPRHNACGPNPRLPQNFTPPSVPPPSPRHNTHSPNPRLPQNFMPPSAPQPPPPHHNTHGSNPRLPQNFTPPLANSFHTYFPRGSMEHVNTMCPPPQAPQHQMLRPPSFPMFCPAQPPPVVNPMFNQNRPPPPHLPNHR